MITAAVWVIIWCHRRFRLLGENLTLSWARWLSADSLLITPPYLQLDPSICTSWSHIISAELDQSQLQCCCPSLLAIHLASYRAEIINQWIKHQTYSKVGKHRTSEMKDFIPSAIWWMFLQPLSFIGTWCGAKTALLVHVKPATISLLDETLDLCFLWWYLLMNWPQEEKHNNSLLSSSQLSVLLHQPICLNNGTMLGRRK